MAKKKSKRKAKIVLDGQHRRAAAEQLEQLKPVPGSYEDVSNHASCRSQPLITRADWDRLCQRIGLLEDREPKTIYVTHNHNY